MPEPEQQQIAAAEPENTPPPVSEDVESKSDTQPEPPPPASPPDGDASNPPSKMAEGDEKPPTKPAEVSKPGRNGEGSGIGRPRAKDRTEAVVRELLANGPRHGESIKHDATKAAKISERTLIAACERLSVRCRHGQWWLPD